MYVCRCPPNAPVDIFQWFLFYVDSANVIQNIYSGQSGLGWSKGRIGLQNYTVADSTSVAFTAARGIQYDQALDDLNGGFSLYAGGADGIIHEYMFNYSDGNWHRGFDFSNTNGLSGAYTWSLSSKAFLYAADNGGHLYYWYRDYNNTSDNQDNHWQTGPNSPDSLYHNGSVCGQFQISYQDSNGFIRGNSIDLVNTINTTQEHWIGAYNVTIQAAMPNTALSCWSYYPDGTNATRDIQYQVFYQDDRGVQEAVTLWDSNLDIPPGTWHYNQLQL